jgi:hypothetical protein
MRRPGGTNANGGGEDCGQKQAPDLHLPYRGFRSNQKLEGEISAQAAAGACRKAVNTLKPWERRKAIQPSCRNAQRWLT